MNPKKNITFSMIKQGIENREFYFALQPQYSLTSNRIVGAEALARWNHNDEYISPGGFIPLLEENGEIFLLEKYLWEAVVRKQIEWQSLGMDIVPISINISRCDFHNPAVFEYILELVQHYGLAPEFLKLEITETAYVKNLKMLTEPMNRLRKMGFQILIDDFGSGYSSLNMLKDFEADVLKLDIKFIDFNEANLNKGKEIIRSVLNMAESLDMQVITEGVETREQLDILHTFHCDVIQGDYFFKPLSLREYKKLLKKTNSESFVKSTDADTFREELLAECTLCIKKGNYEEALKLALRAADTITVNRNPEQYFQVMNLTGITYGVMGNDLKAVEYYLSGLVEALRLDHSFAVGRFYNNIGYEYQNLKEHNKAIEYFLLSLQELEKSDSRRYSDYFHIYFITHMNLCMEYFEISDYEKSEHHLECARTLLKHTDNQDTQLSFYITQSRLYLATGKRELVEKSFPILMEKALNIRDKIDFWEDMKKVYELAEEVKRYDSMYEILKAMDEQLNSFSTEASNISIRVSVKELWIHYYELTGNADMVRRFEKECLQLYRLQNRELDKIKVSAIDSIIALKMSECEKVTAVSKFNIDQLTGVGNRYKLEIDSKNLIEMSVAEGHAIGLGMIDIDNFKEVNDALGHLEGDKCIKKTAKLLTKAVKGIGGVYRYGGDEFVILIADAKTDTIKPIAQNIAEILRREGLTVSQGYISAIPTKHQNIWQMLSAADRELYHVKRNGKNNFRIINISEESTR